MAFTGGGAAGAAFAGVAVDADRRRITRGPAAATLTPSEFTVFDLIWRQRGRTGGVARFRALTEALYGHRADGGPDTDPLRVFVCRLRRALLPLGLGVEVVRGSGWRLTDLGFEAVALASAPGPLGRGAIDGATIAEIRRLDQDGFGERAIADRLALPVATVATVISGRRPHRGAIGRVMGGRVGGKPAPAGSDAAGRVFA